MSKADIEQSSDISESDGTSTPVKPTLFQRWKAHMKKWWWLYLIIFCIIVLVTVLPIIYVGVPNFANQYINDHNFDTSGLTITDPTPDSFHIQQSQEFQVGGGFSGSGRLSPFNASLSAPGSDRSFATFEVPEVEFSNGAVLDIDQDLHLSCVSCFSQLAASAVSSADFGILITGKPDLEIKGLPTAHLDIHKNMKMQGYNAQEFLNRDGAFNVTDINILDPPVNGYNVNATVAFKNPTPFNVQVGSVGFNLTIGDNDLGYIDIPDLTLRRDLTNTDILGNISIKTLVREGIWKSSTEELGKVTIGMRGNRCVYDGKEIPYFTSAFRAVNVSLEVDLMKYAKYLL
ncbi:hypothetical protein P170DRAFT_513869 [Aspergillus steynii IBT 23096]|uniref:Uncharacterized protein n=1 Tax=Aspergillus steynii IBT 23096 TaxID=1392250 RepID=A0A2I2FSA0_9EURO|nr:uncharacterized protein P170DRAFT_513869 [Aspergillus steynii IBT 23096]PLB43510.1 hypothetical protein P170DRAFT_513869 [Aspergillus steynii IBT 23096]